MQTVAMQITARPLVAGRARVARAQRSTTLRAVAAQDKPLWLPGIDAPKHLPTDAPGFSGFDPLGLGTDSDRLKWYTEAEKTNGRWAMAAVAGILFTDLIGKPKWFEAGAEEYWMPFPALLATTFLFTGFFELKRYNGWAETGTSGFLNSFPFDPMGQYSKDNATKEVKNGRLAMVAFIGFAVQALVTRQGPIEALTSHLSNPFSNNIIGSIGNLPNVIGK